MNTFAKLEDWVKAVPNMWELTGKPRWPVPQTLEPNRLHFIAGFKCCGEEFGT